MVTSPRRDQESLSGVTHAVIAICLSAVVVVGVLLTPSIVTFFQGSAIDVGPIAEGIAEFSEARLIGNSPN